MVLKHKINWWVKFFKYGGFKRFGYKWLFKKGGKSKVVKSVINRKTNIRAKKVYTRRYFNNKKVFKGKLYKIQSKRCAGCKNKFMKDALTIDHIKKVSKGGSSGLDNLQLLCRLCHEKKDGVRLLNF